MNKKTLIYITALLIFISSNSFSEISASVRTPYPFDGTLAAAEVAANVDTLIYDYSLMVNSISSLVVDSFNNSMINSIPIGASKINHFTFGVSINPTASLDLKNPFASYSNNSAAGGMPKIGAGINVALFFGMSLGEKFDLAFSAFVLPKSVVEKFNLEYKGFSWSLYAGGVKLRYVHRKKNSKKKYDFTSIVISPGFYFAYNPVSYNNSSLGFSSSYSTGIPAPLDTGTFTIQSMDISGNIVIIVVDLEITFNFRIFYILNLFLSVGASLNFSYFEVDGTVTGECVIGASTDNAYIDITGKSYGSKILPRIAGGFELNVFVKIFFQGIISWSKGDTLYGATVGIRFDF